MSRTPIANRNAFYSHNENIFNQNISGISEKPAKRSFARQSSKDRIDLSPSPGDRKLISKYKSENESLQLTIQKMNEDIKILKQENAKLKKANDQMVRIPNIEDEGIFEKYQNALVQIQNYESTLQTKDRIIDQLALENQNSEHNIAKLNEKIIKKKNKIANLNKKLNEISLKDKGTTSIDNIDTSCVLNDNDESNANLDKIFSLLKKIEIQEGQFRQQIALQQKSANICKYLLELTEEYDDRLTMNNEVKLVQDDEIAKLEQTNESLKKSLDGIKRQNTDYQNEIINLKVKQIEENLLTLRKNENDTASLIESKNEENHEIIAKQMFIIDTLTTYIMRVLTENDSFIPLIYQSEPIISDTGIRNFVIESIKALKSNLYKTFEDHNEPENTFKFKDYEKEEMKIIYDQKNALISNIFNSFENVEYLINHYAYDKNNDNTDFSILIALCAANSNLGNRIKNINSEIDEMVQIIPDRFVYDPGMSNFDIIRKYLSDSKELFNKMFTIVDDAEEFFDFGSSEINEILEEVIMEVSIFTNKMKSVCPHYKFNGILSDFPETFIDFNETLQNELDSLKQECEDKNLKLTDESRINTTQKDCIDELLENKKQILKDNEEKEKEIIELKGNLSEMESKLNELKETVKDQNQQICSMKANIEQKTIVLNNTRKIHKSQIENIMKSEREKHEKEIEEFIELQKEKEAKLESKISSNKIIKKEMKANISTLKEKIESLNIENHVLEDKYKQKEQELQLLDAMMKKAEENYETRIQNLSEQVMTEIDQIPSPTIISSVPIDKETVIFLNQIIPLVANLTKTTIAFDPADQNSIEDGKMKILNALRRLGLTANRNKKKIKQKDSPANELNTWTNWAIDIASKMKIPTENLSEIRVAISDVVLSQVAKCAMLNLIHSLRVQKKLLVEYNLCDKNRRLNTRNATFRNVISFTLAVRAISRTIQKK